MAVKRRHCDDGCPRIFFHETAEQDVPRAVIGFFRSIIEGAERRLTVTVIVCASEYYDDIRIIIHRLIPVTKGWFCAAIVLDMLSGYARAADSVIPCGGKAAFPVLLLCFSS